MARRTRYCRRYELPASVVDVVKCLCADYERRARAIKYESVEGAVLERYAELNAAIDKALEALEAGIRREMLEDIHRGRGYDFSPVSVYLSKNTYYQRKKRMIFEIAKDLSLI